MRKLLRLLIFFTASFFSLNNYSQTVNNGGVTGSPCANSGINNGYAAGWSGCGFSPDLCCLTMPSYVSSSQVTPAASPDGGTWLGLAALVECARTTITGLTAGQTYTLYFCGACFGTGTSIYNSSPANPRIIVVGSATFVPSIPMVASTWNRYSMTFVATAATMTLQCDHPTGTSYASLDGFSLSSTAVCKPVVLPIELKDFSATYNKGLKQVDLNWSVAMEKDVDYYSVEKSDDAIHFKEIEKVYARYGDHYSNKEYATQDPNPRSANVNYYRLKMFDKDGEYTYSAMRSVYFTDIDTELMIIPNPASDKAELKFSSGSDKTWTINIFDKRGNKIMESVHYATAGVNSMELELSAYETGLYFVTVTDGELFYKRKLVKK